MEIHLSAEEIFGLKNFNITNTLILSFVITLGFLFFSKIISSRLKLVPLRWQNFFEALIETILNFMESVLEDKKKARKFFPLVATIFIFVILSNWLEVLPGLGSIFLRSPSSDLNFTLAIAISAVISIQVFGILSIGFIKYGKRFINFSSPINFFVGILEIISEAAKIISFSFRLFGNIFAGEVLLIVVYFLAPYILPLPFMFLEIFVGFIQALVFSMLTLVFLKIATVEVEH
ncbi:MAG: ATP synthase F0 subunit A [Candidatus Portnoybacteria bacterium RIFCSPLOWO2_01_FULL_43_11]|uniref:ATP synthase subunit a n=3 Tax=Candidatus Portnoyibacteriota TaxID=1817913 RepID=A0A1G2FC09_9BACT|nr:MAG: ATP synthase F0 subunit A [Candidatus Portnoybacteria bacterium RIFCSPHIGHO2_01_FULL_40_12b]OGZ37184.1 MAG: ATP synthase F0 subunit A [Candidatus Portnoybacteria bacterium RIFCSPHIGHO2_02_FULL_40_23]OGZ37671.1 MAG: ATP synthase F0 subunit A [Candidatus Portnoybacteria bacterium RIFCSPHIGHO2_12_FULL_40_11]OGZ38831.1 MAG: ATP synthase F0 subunit A [Candidatus Portnoybacteria bacterium RIFCSPLOWO2_01_FULL_43_11]